MQNIWYFCAEVKGRCNDYLLLLCEVWRICWLHLLLQLSCQTKQHRSALMLCSQTCEVATLCVCVCVFAPPAGQEKKAS